MTGVLVPEGVPSLCPQALPGIAATQMPLEPHSGAVIKREISQNCISKCMCCTNYLALDIHFLVDGEIGINYETKQPYWEDKFGRQEWKKEIMRSA